MPISNRAYTSSSSFVARMNIAKDVADARHADKVDLGNRLRRQVRAEHVALTQVSVVADREWHAANDPVTGPAAVGGGRVHPSRVRALAAFVADQGWSDNPADPVEPIASLAETIETMTRESRERLAAAEAAMLEHDAARVGMTVEEFEADRRRRALEAEQLHAERSTRDAAADRAAGR